MWEFLPSSLEIIYRNQLSRTTQFKVRITATVAFTLQKAGLLLFSISFFFFWAKKKKTPVPEIWILNTCGPPCFLLQTCQGREASIPISSSCESKTQKAEQYVLYVPYRLTYFKMAHEYGASNPGHANANVKCQAKRNTWN